MLTQLKSPPITEKCSTHSSKGTHILKVAFTIAGIFYIPVMLFRVYANHFVIEPLFNVAVHFVLLTSLGTTKLHEYTCEYKYEYMMYNRPVLHASKTHQPHLFRSKSFPKMVTNLK